MPRFGAHMSVAGGLPRAVERAVATGCEVAQIFTKSVFQWRARPLPESEVEAFRAAAAAARLSTIVAHASYLINPATSDPALRRQSLAALAEEADRAERLGLAGLVLHPGAAGDAGAPRRVADALAAVLAARPAGALRLVVEQTAGQGTCLGRRFEDIAAIRAAVPPALRDRVAVCLDTCHLLAAGYAIHTAEGYRATMRSFERVLGLDALAVLHVNDSKTPVGSRVDRHAAIGAGHVGLEGFARLVNDRRLARVPMILETPKQGGTTLADPFDLANLARLRALVGHGGARRSPARVATAGGGGRRAV